ncbi:hypothetical protein RND81_01G125000 [Saponaria officinalis]|uniref:SWIM-type domain-containing protein n=1 Tax=Saponaria officinalis TaxID=3572 RepID=A0AAW1N712_SAPOF
MIFFVSGMYRGRNNPSYRRGRGNPSYRGGRGSSSDLTLFQHGNKKLIASDLSGLAKANLDIILTPTASTSHNNVPTITSTPQIDQPSEYQLVLNTTPGGSEEWRRNVSIDYKPKIGQFFSTLKDGINFYGVYAAACGFDPRLYTQKRFHGGVIKSKLIVCNREGYRCDKQKVVLDSPEEIDANIKPYDPKKTKITRIGCPAMIKFRFNGNGYVVVQFREGHNHRLSSLRNKQFQKISRNLSLFHKKTIIDHSKVNIGPTRTFRICKEYVDGYENIGASLVDFKNFQRDIKCFIGDKDAQMFINHLQNLAETEQVSFDPTYGTNKYCMIFTPFTGVDHHKRSVTFAAALLSHEDEQSFTWVFQKFLDAMGQREPQCIINDQDPAMKNVLPVFFKQAMHRFCMWHIMQKVPDKVGISISKDTDFVSRLSAIVWDSNLEPVQFEQKCAMDQQRHSQRSLDRDSVHSLPQLATPLRFEAHASNVYTHTVFYEFQSEIKASLCSCSVIGFTLDNSLELLDIVDAYVGKTYRVVYNGVNSDAECSCKLFERKGILCRHIVWVFSGKQLKKLPDKYILMRWSKNAQKVPLYELHGQLIDDFDATDLRKKDMCSLWSEFYATIGVLKTLPTNHITELADTLKAFRVKLKPQVESLTKEQELEMLLGCRSSTEVNILPPSHSKNKGSGKRMISAKQQSVAKAEKPKRLCANCKQMVHHDKRNCPHLVVSHAPTTDVHDQVF